MNKEDLPTTCCDNSLIVVDASGTSKDERTPDPNKSSNNKADCLKGFFGDNLETKNEPPRYDGSDSLQGNMDEKETNTQSASSSSHMTIGETGSGTTNGENTTEPKSFENRVDTMEKSFEDYENKNVFTKSEELERVLERLEVDIDKHEMDTSHYGDNMNRFSNDPSETSSLSETLQSDDIPKFTNKHVTLKSSKNDGMLNHIEVKHDQKQAIKKGKTENLHNETKKHLKNDDIFLENIKINCDLESSLKEVPGALDYIRKLHHLIHKHIKKIRKLRKKLCEQTAKQYNDSSTQTDEDAQQTNVVSSATDTANIKEAESKPKSLAEDIAEAAEMALQNTGFVYEETSGMYYDYNTGYYYNAEYGLYYDGSTGTYMSYNQDTQSYEFHSQVCVPSNQQSEKKPVRQKRRRKGNTSKVKPISCELSSLEHCFSRLSIDNLRSTALDISKAAPCMRVIVEASEVPSMKIGSLFIITRDGGSLGREGHHSIIIGDLNVSKHHLKFTFEDKEGCYHVTDLDVDQEAPRVVIRYNRAERHKNELKSLKKLCGIKSYNADSKLAEGYTDRAQRRRDTVGSQNPHEKTQVASVDESISKENKGFKLLQKMGWKEGESLGKENEGIVEPIKVTGNQGTTGIGAEMSVLPATNEKSAIWVKTRERFEKLPESKDILGLDSD
nr:unnamed protein product [Callosobruchus analis]